jgi:hypothetical protein
MGILVNFLSSPVIVGFTNAAALIIGLSQLSKMLNVPFPRTDNFVRTSGTCRAAAADAHPDAAVRHRDLRHHHRRPAGGAEDPRRAAGGGADHHRQLGHRLSSATRPCTVRHPDEEARSLAAAYAATRAPSARLGQQTADQSRDPRLGVGQGRDPRFARRPCWRRTCAC